MIGRLPGQLVCNHIQQSMQEDITHKSTRSDSNAQVDLATTAPLLFRQQGALVTNGDWLLWTARLLLRLPDLAEVTTAAYE